MIYVAGPIDALHDDTDRRLELARWRDLVHQSLINRGLATFDPTRPFGAPMTAVDQVHAINQAAVDVADGVVALLPPWASTIGTPMEIYRAVNAGKPVVVLGAKPSLQLKAMRVGVWDLDQSGIDNALSALQIKLDNPDPPTETAPAHGDLVEQPINWVGDRMFKPVRAYDGDAGFDLVVSEDVTIPPRRFVDVPCGIRVELPPRTWGLIIGRSSTLRKKNLMVTQGVIDNGWRGPLFAGCQSLDDDRSIEVKRGERVAQLIPFSQRAWNLRLERVDTLSDSDRGENGFGSTGS